MIIRQLKFIATLVYFASLIIWTLPAQVRNTDSFQVKLNNVKSDSSRIDILNKLADNYKTINSDSALFYIRQSILTAQSINDSLRLANSHAIYGNILKNIGNYSMAIKEHQKALSIYESNKNFPGIARCNNNIAIIHVYQGNQHTALKYYQVSEKILRELKNNVQLLRVINNIGRLYQKQKKYKKAISYYQEVIDKASLSQNKQVLSYAYMNTGECYRKINMPEKSLLFFNKSLKANKELNNQLVFAETYNYLAQLYLDGINHYSNTANKRKSCVTSISYSMKSLTISSLNNYKILQKDAFFNLYIAHKELGNINKSLTYLEKHLAYKDSLYSLNKMKEFENLEAKFQSEKKVLQIENLEKQHQINTKTLKILQTRQFFLTLIIVLFLLFIIVLLLIRKKLKTKNTTINEQNEKISSQYEEIAQQNDALEKYKNHLEEMIKEQTKDLIEAKENAIKADNLKTAFLENLSHEIRTPLNAIVGYSNLMEYEENISENSKNFIDHINNGSNSLLRIIDSIMQVSRMQVSKLKLSSSSFNLYNLLKEIDKFFRNTNSFKDKKELTLHLNIDTINTNTEVYSDRDSLYTILFNLVDNALKFTEKGTIEIGVSKENENQILFYVKDTGIGIEQEDIQFIFDKFRKIEPGKTKLYRGLGLGLTVVKNMVEQLNGEIWLDSEAGKGSEFYFSLPNK
ncbi:MAG: tetratricopeptide repeat-containing sensor histidine kinase [Bacteroidota bacterium]